MIELAWTLFKLLANTVTAVVCVLLFTGYLEIHRAPRKPRR